MVKIKKTLAILLSLLMLSAAFTAVGIGSASAEITGNYVLVCDKGDLGNFSADGTITTTFSAESYVWVRNYDTGVQYCTDGWAGFVNSAELKNEHNLTQTFNKLYVPAGTVTLTLVDNGNDTFTLSYGEGQTTTAPATTPTQGTTATEQNPTSATVTDPVVTTNGGTQTLTGNYVLVCDKGDLGNFSADGTITTTFSADSYVWVRNYDTGVQYCTDGWAGFVNSAELKNEHNLTQTFNKLYVPAGTVTLTLVDNGNDTFTLSYGEGQATTAPATTSTQGTTSTEQNPTSATVTDPVATTNGGTQTLTGNYVLVCDKGDLGNFSADGTLTTTFSADSYVWVRNYDTGVQYCTDGWAGFVNSAVLKNEHNLTQTFDKLYVPAGTVTLTLVDNGNDTFTLSYGEGQATTAPATTPTQGTTATEPESTTSNTNPTTPVADMYKVSSMLMNATINNGVDKVTAGSSYSAIVVPNEGFKITSANVSMGNESVNVTVTDTSVIIFIAEVKADISIIVVAEKSSEPTSPAISTTEPTVTTPVTTAPTVKKTTVTLKTTKATLYVKGTTTIKATVKNAVGKTTYKSSNTKVAKVDSKGKVTALKKGTAKITVTNNKIKKTFSVTVKNPKLNATSKKLKVNRTFTLKITGKVGKATFKSSNKKIATVNSKGKITAKKKGDVTITVKTNGMSLKCKIKVVK